MMRNPTIILTLFIASCGNNNLQENNNVQNNSIDSFVETKQNQEKLNYRIDTTKLYFSDSHKIFEISISYPVISGEIEDSNLRKINKLLYSEFVPSDSVIKEKLSDYEGDKQNIDNEDNNWHGEESTSFNIDFLSNNYLSLTKNWYGEYKGAAHPSSDAYTLNLDIKTGQILSFDDFFNDGIYTVISKKILETFDSISKDQKDSLNLKHSHYFEFYFNKVGCYENKDDCLTVYYPPHRPISDLLVLGWEGVWFTLSKEEIIPYLKDKWKQEILK